MSNKVYFLIFACMILQSCATNRNIISKNDIANDISNTSGQHEEVVLPKEVDDYFVGIRSDLERHWSRPPGARNGQKVLVRIMLMPGGELIAAKVVQSSGDDVFDQYAVAAVENVGTFNVPSDPDLFDKYFRQFTIDFIPTDLGR